MTKTYKISLDTIDRVKDFVNIINRFESEADLSSDRYVVDAKSIMGIFSLNLMQPLQLTIYGDKEIDEIEQALQPFLLKE
jgi:phosphotransferase system HPr-like phosphotransfer protein